MGSGFDSLPAHTVRGKQAIRRSTQPVERNFPTPCPEYDGTRLPHETASEGILHNVRDDDNCNRKQTSPVVQTAVVMAETVGQEPTSVAGDGGGWVNVQLGARRVGLASVGHARAWTAQLIPVAAAMWRWSNAPQRNRRRFGPDEHRGRDEIDDG